MKKLIGLCQGRHDIPGIDDYIFPVNFFSEQVEMFDFHRMAVQIHFKLYEMEPYDELKLYVTGYTPALAAVINYCADHYLNLTLMHWDRKTEKYIPQEMWIGNYWDEDGISYENSSIDCLLSYLSGQVHFRDISVFGFEMLVPENMRGFLLVDDSTLGKIALEARENVNR